MTAPARSSLTVVPARSSLTVLLVDDGTAASGQLALCGRPAVDWLLDTVAAIGPDALAVVGCGSSGDELRERIAAHPALAGLPPADPEAPDGVTLILRCSTPLVRTVTLRKALRLIRADRPRSRSPRAVVVESVPEQPWWAPASPPTLAALAVAGLAVTGHHRRSLLGVPAAVGRFGPAVVTRQLEAAGVQVLAAAANPVEALCLNRPAERVRAETALYQRIAAGWLASGVLIDDPATTRIDATVRIGEGAHIHPNTELVGNTVIGPGSRVGPATTISDSRIGAGCLIRYAVCQDVEVGDHANVGPYCWLRSGSRLGARARAGSFVELADSVVGEDTSIPHLGGLMSADVGRGCNIAGFSGPANFDGTRKHRVRIGDHVSIGAGTILIAPLSVGDGAQTAAGSVITKDVPSGALAAARTEQRNFAGWTVENRPGSAAALAVQQALTAQQAAVALEPRSE
jgi:acetyltransferase-like isoleucine patch superfamily enzyme